MIFRGPEQRDNNQAEQQHDEQAHALNVVFDVERRGEFSERDSGENKNLFEREADQPADVAPVREYQRETPRNQKHCEVYRPKLEISWDRW